MFKRLRKGAYEYSNYLVVYTPWLNDKWDGPPDSFRGWKVYRAGSSIERRLLLDAFPNRHAAFTFVEGQLKGG
ncbi:MAG: hypothetical protein M3Y24_06940 [Acidobacteriota bacterium]|nr:hypothetical protein [Acidobacteriota bacterium]